MKVIILNGPMGVEKTAVGKYIAEHTPRTDEWLKVSPKSLEYFSSLDNTLDTTNLSIKDVAEKIISG